MNYWIDYWLNRVSMYRLVSISLTVLWISAVVFTMAGVLDYSPYAMAVCGSLLIATTFLSNRLFGFLFGVRTHDESTYITALILFFLFTPSLDLDTLLALGLAGMIASASKYVLVYRSRHIFNPAAIAAAIIGLTGLGFASWWVATPVLLPVTAATAFLILYKTRRLVDIGLTFIAIAVPLVIMVLLIGDTSLPDAFNLLPSWPFLFFAGFMLSEPLTLPAKKWQRLAEVAIVAVLFAIPIHIGSYLITPALALVIGNAFAFLVTQRRHVNLTFIQRHALTPTSEEYEFEPNHAIRFEAGQYMEITIPHAGKDGRGLRRVFSMTSAPGEPTVRFGVKFYEPSSTFKQALKHLESRHVIQATNIGGDFTLPKDATTPILFIAGGIGITPFISHLRYLKRTRQARDITLVYAVNSIKEIAYADVLRKSEVKITIVTQANGALPDKSWSRFDAPTITEELLHKAIPDISHHAVYISGPPAMVNATKAHLRQLKAKNIKSDYFTGY